MSGLSNQELLNSNDFDPSLFVRSLCDNKKIIVSEYSNINFLPGWKSIVEEFLYSLYNFSISIIEITDAHSQLDVSFKVVNNTKEVLVWRAIEKARQKSRSVCALCGDNTYELRQKKTVMLCKACTKNSSKRDGTGTWLDKY